MIKLAPIFLAVIFGYVMTRVSAWRTARMLDEQSSKLDDPILRVLVQRLAKAQGFPDLAVHVYENPMINGLAAPDGRVFVTRGFLDKYRAGLVSAEEILSVVAHELGHVALGHSKRRMIDFTGQNALRVGLAMVLGRFIPFVGVYIADFISRAVGARLSRADEYEADAYAAALLTKAGIGTEAQVTLFRKLEKLSPGGGSVSWLRSHPQTEDRILAIETLSAKWGQAPKIQD